MVSGSPPGAARPAAALRNAASGAVRGEGSSRLLASRKAVRTRWAPALVLRLITIQASKSIASSTRATAR